MPKAKAQDQQEPQAKKLQETFTHPLELPKENAQSDEDEPEQLPKNNNNNNVESVKPAEPMIVAEMEQEAAEPEIETQPELATDNQNGNKSAEEEVLEGDGIVTEELPAGKVVRRKKSNTQPPNNLNNNNTSNSTSQAPRVNHRASVAKMEGLAALMDSSIMTSSTEIDGKGNKSKVKHF